MRFPSIKIRFTLLWITCMVFGLFSCYFGSPEIVEYPDENAPEINIRQGSTLIHSGDTFDFGSIPTSGTQSITYAIENLGRGDLVLKGTPIVVISGAGAAMFSVSTQPASPIAMFSYRYFTIDFTPAAAAVYNATVTIISNDPDESTFSFTITGTGITVAAPEINVQVSGADILSPAGNDDFGSVNIGTPGNHVYTIYNIGTLTLTLTGSPLVLLTGSSDFSVTADPVSPVIPSGSTSFTIRFTPSSAGVKSATVTIVNNDSDENPYTFTITGTGSVAPAPEINIRHGSTPLLSGAGTFSFGNINQGFTSAATTFTIENNGTSPLLLTGGPNYVTSSDPQFAITAQPITPVAAPGTTTFIMTFTPSALGLQSSTISIANNDADENPYTFTVNGTGVAIPEINILDDASATLLSGSAKSFGTTPVGTPKPLLFTIQNLDATSTLNLPSNPIVTITGDSVFTVTTQPASSSVAPGGNIPFWVTFNPDTAGVLNTAILSIANDDPDGNENPYIITISGTGTAIPEPEISVYQGVSTNCILSGGTYDFGGMSVGGTAIDITFTIENIGAANLDLTAGVIVAGAGFSRILDAATPIAPGASTTFTIRFNAPGAGAYTGTVTIANNDSDENPYTFTVTATGMNPEIQVREGTTNIADGGTYTYGNVNVGSSRQLTFTIENDAAATSNLYLTGAPKVSITGSADFAIASQPASTSINPGGSTTFAVRYTPSGTGADTATISIANNDMDENPYNFTITGTGVNPEIEVRDPSNVPLVDGTGSYSHGNQKVNTAGAALTYTIRNTGTMGDLHLLGAPASRVVVHGADAVYFAVVQPASGTIAPGGSTTFTIAFNPTGIPGIGAKSVTVSIYNDDLDESIYSFTVTGAGTVPDINVTYGSNDFGNVKQGTASGALVFTIANNAPAGSNAPLVLNGTPRARLTGVNPGDFTITVQPSTPINPAATSTMQITFTPSSTGLRTATVEIDSDDPDTPTYSFTIRGAGTVPDINVTYGSNDFGNVTVSTTSAPLTFTLQNTAVLASNADLILTGTPFVIITGADAAMFTITVQPSSPVGPASNSNFEITFTPGSTGLKTATVEIASDDPDAFENPYTFSIQGTGN